MDDPRYTRRGALSAGVVLLGSLAGCSSSDGQGPTDTPTDGQTASPTETATDDELSIGADELASGFTSPVGVESPGDGRHYVVDQPGTIEVIDGEGVRDEPFLDLGDRVVDVSGYSERGVLGLAFHPGYADNGRVFVRYSAPVREGTPDNYAHTFVLAEFSADPDTGTADGESEEPVLEVPQPQPNHNAGAVTFGPDGYLYVATGDGGGANDQGNGHFEDWYDAVDGGNGQELRRNLLGSILRIDVDGSEDGNYAVPEDNPLVGDDGLDEQYAWGFRNPWRMSFGPDGRLFVADVGQNRYEEVNVVERGGNYGWNVREGTHCFQADECPEETPDGEPLVDPIIEYPHEGEGITGVTVIGGYLYDGEAIPGLQGRYVFADWQAGGELFVADEREDDLWATSSVPVQGNFGTNVLSFGRDSDGELLVCTTEEQEVVGDSGAVYRLTSAEE